MFGGAPHTSYQGHFLVPVKQEVCQLPINQVRVQFMQFINLGPVNFDTLVFHTGTGEIHKLGFYFNEHIVSLVVLNAMFNNSSSGDRAQFDQVKVVFFLIETKSTLSLLHRHLSSGSSTCSRVRPRELLGDSTRLVELGIKFQISWHLKPPLVRRLCT